MIWNPSQFGSQVDVPDIEDIYADLSDLCGDVLRENTGKLREVAAGIQAALLEREDPCMDAGMLVVLASRALARSVQERKAPIAHRSLSCSPMSGHCDCPHMRAHTQQVDSSFLATPGMPQVETARTCNRETLPSENTWHTRRIPKAARRFVAAPRESRSDSASHISNRDASAPPATAWNLCILMR